MNWRSIPIGGGRRSVDGRDSIFCKINAQEKSEKPRRGGMINAN
jgi:hypothetical protein